ncbi:MAG: 50S ribosomal protein L22 [Candidatus Makaraimicrobium thalassicum]|nr:MAG: 50S ribosomal protein L22 [Candidatus Omnitrophota bacterium]
MLAKAKAKYIRISARKARLVIDLLKGKTVEDANFILDNIGRKASSPIKKALNSAFANVNCERKDKFLSKDVFISGIRADGGPMLKRYRAATMGRATPVRHRTAHIYVELDKVTAGKKGSGSK